MNIDPIKEAERLDAILERFTPTLWRKQAKPDESDLCEFLESRGHVEIFNHDSDGYWLKLEEEGNTFIQNGGYVSEKKKYEEDLALKKKNSRMQVIGLIVAIGTMIAAFLSLKTCS